MTITVPPNGLEPAVPLKTIGSYQDPHSIPLFDSQSLCAPQTSVLYLPPLLSALPEGLKSQSILSGHAPAVTETRLPDIDPASLSLHKALHHFAPASSNYASTPYFEAFNWAELDLPDADEREWYCVVFRSKRKAGSDAGRRFLPFIRLYLVLWNFS
jgi:hypothetical protein